VEDKFLHCNRFSCFAKILQEKAHTYDKSTIYIEQDEANVENEEAMLMGIRNNTFKEGHILRLPTMDIRNC